MMALSDAVVSRNNWWDTTTKRPRPLHTPNSCGGGSAQVPRFPGSSQSGFSSFDEGSWVACSLHILLAIAPSLESISTNTH